MVGTSCLSNGQCPALSTAGHSVMVGCIQTPITTPLTSHKGCILYRCGLDGAHISWVIKLNEGKFIMYYVDKTEISFEVGGTY